MNGELKVCYTIHWNRDRIVVSSKVNCSAKTGCAQKEAYNPRYKLCFIICLD